jgi:hypothetical protein
MLARNDLRRGEPGEYSKRYSEGTNIVVLTPDMAEFFSCSESATAALRVLIDGARRTFHKTATEHFLGELRMNRFRLTIRSAMTLVFCAGVGFAALRNPSAWWAGGVLACLIGLLLTACVGAMYSAERERAFWVGIVVFGGGYLLLTSVRFADDMGNPVAVIDRVLDMVALDRSVPTLGAAVLAEMNGEFRPASVGQIDRTEGAYLVNFNGSTDYQAAWLRPAQIRLQGSAEYHAIGNNLVVILVAMMGSIVAVGFYDSRERRRVERPSQPLGGNRD